VKFFLFGMGARTKLIYRAGIRSNARTGQELRRWKIRKEVIVPPDYAVWLETEDGAQVTLREDKAAVWLEERGHRTALDGTDSAVRLPDFAGNAFPRVLRVLHQEILVNITAAGPVPNFFVMAEVRLARARPARSLCCTAYRRQLQRALLDGLSGPVHTRPGRG
jgi:hypothetical protein